MKKTYWWRVVIFLVCLIFILGSYFSYCEKEFLVCLWSVDYIVLRTFFHLSLSLIIVSVFLLFVSDNIFKKWFTFASIWILASLFFIFLAPEYQRGWILLTPERKMITQLMNETFVFISLILITIWQIKERKGQKK